MIESIPSVGTGRLNLGSVPERTDNNVEASIATNRIGSDGPHAHGSQPVNGHLRSEITNCTTLLRRLRIQPHRYLSTSGSIYCSGSDVERVRFKLTIERYKFPNWWNIQGTNDSGWRNGRYASAGLAVSCASGFHKYRAKGVGAMEDTNGNIHYAEKYSSQRNTSCYLPE